MESILAIYFLGIIVSAIFIFILEIWKNVRRSYPEEGALMLAGIMFSLFWPLVLVAYLFDKSIKKS